MTDKKIKIINNSDTLKRIGAANVRLDPGINKITPSQYEAANKRPPGILERERGNRVMGTKSALGRGSGRKETV